LLIIQTLYNFISNFDSNYQTTQFFSSIRIHVIYLNSQETETSVQSAKNTELFRGFSIPHMPLIWAYKVFARSESRRLRSRCECKNDPHDERPGITTSGPYTRPVSSDPALFPQDARQDRPRFCMPRKMNKIE